MANEEEDANTEEMDNTVFDWAFQRPDDNPYLSRQQLADRYAQDLRDGMYFGNYQVSSWRHPRTIPAPSRYCIVPQYRCWQELAQVARRLNTVMAMYFKTADGYYRIDSNIAGMDYRLSSMPAIIYPGDLTVL